MNINKKTKTDWTVEDIERFWGWLSTTQRKEQDYFAYQVGDSIYNLLKKTTAIKGNYLDYGCGLGHMFPFFLKQRVNCYGIEFSSDSVGEVNKRNIENPFFKGVQEVQNFPSSFDSNFFDIITFIEVIEHLNDKYLDDTLDELYRILKPGGKLFISTPFDEKLSDNNIYCPFCNSEFHRMQHMQSFNVDSLTKLIKKHKFKINYCNNVNLYFYSKKIKTKLTAYIKTLGKKYINKTRGENYQLKPHLIAIVSK